MVIIRILLTWNIINNKKKTRQTSCFWGLTDKTKIASSCFIYKETQFKIYNMYVLVNINYVYIYGICLMTQKVVKWRGKISISANIPTLKYGQKYVSALYPKYNLD